MHYAQIVGPHAAVYDFHKGGIVGAVLREEHHTHSVAALLRDRNSVQEYELVGYLNHYAGTVAGIGIPAFSTSVGHILEHRQTFLYDVMVFCSVDIDDKADAAGIVFVVR